MDLYSASHSMCNKCFSVSKIRDRIWKTLQNVRTDGEMGNGHVDRTWSVSIERILMWCPVAMIKVSFWM